MYCLNPKVVHTLFIHLQTFFRAASCCHRCSARRGRGQSSRSSRATKMCAPCYRALVGARARSMFACLQRARCRARCLFECQLQRPPNCRLPAGAKQTRRHLHVGRPVPCARCQDPVLKETLLLPVDAQPSDFLDDLEERNFFNCDVPSMFFACIWRPVCSCQRCCCSPPSLLSA